MIRKLLLLITLMYVCYGLNHAQEISRVYVTSDTLQVYFRQDAIQLEPQFRNNGTRLRDFSLLFKDLLHNPQNRVRSILIVSGASPEGSSTHNRYLSDNRAKVIYNYLINNHLADPAHIEIESRGVDWKGLEEYVQASNLPYKEEVLEILALPEWISKGGKVVDGRKHRLMNYQGGKVWRELYDLYFANLRSTRVMIAYNIKKEDVASGKDTIYVRKTDTVYVNTTNNYYFHYNTFVNDTPADTTVMKPVTVEQPQTPPRPQDPHKPFRMVIKTNLLYDGLVIPNIGAEVGIYKGLALSGYYQNIWLRDKGWTKWHRFEGFEAGLKWYLNKEKRPFKGHRVELYGQMVTWDFTYDGTGYLAERWACGGGIGYGYAMPLFRRFNLDFEVGVGYLSGTLHKYIPQDGHRVWQSVEKFQWIVPTKLGITLQWLIGPGNYNEKRRLKGE